MKLNNRTNLTCLYFLQVPDANQQNKKKISKVDKKSTKSKPKGKVFTYARLFFGSNNSSR